MFGRPVTSGSRTWIPSGSSGKISVPHGIERHGAESGGRLALPVAFVVEEEERAVAAVIARQPPRPAERPAELVAQESRRFGGAERVARFQLRAAIILEQISVVDVGAALRDHGNLRAALAEFRGCNPGVDLEFANDIDGKRHGGSAL